MKNMPLRAILIASFVMTGAWPALANLPSLAPSFFSPAVEIEIADASPATTDQTSYAQQARDDVREWRGKLDQFGESAKANSNKAWKSTSEDLDAAWVKTRDASDRLETVAIEDWDSAKISYQRASGELSAKWAKVRGDMK